MSLINPIRAFWGAEGEGEVHVEQPNNLETGQASFSFEEIGCGDGNGKEGGIRCGSARSRKAVTAVVQTDGGVDGGEHLAGH